MLDGVAVVVTRMGSLGRSHGVDERLSGLVAVAVAVNLEAGSVKRGHPFVEFLGLGDPNAVRAGAVIVGRKEARRETLNTAVGGELHGAEDQLVVAPVEQRQRLGNGAGRIPTAGDRRVRCRDEAQREIAGCRHLLGSGQTVGVVRPYGPKVTECGDAGPGGDRGRAAEGDLHVGSLEELDAEFLIGLEESGEPAHFARRLTRLVSHDSLETMAITEGHALECRAVQVDDVTLDHGDGDRIAHPVQNGRVEARAVVEQHRIGTPPDQCSSGLRSIRTTKAGNDIVGAAARRVPSAVGIVPTERADVDSLAPGSPQGHMGMTLDETGHDAGR